MKSYVSLFSCEFQHDYQQKSGLPLRVLPTEDTLKNLSSSDCLFKQELNGFQVICQIENQKADALQVLFESEPLVVLKFRVDAIDPVFFNMTNPLFDRKSISAGAPAVDSDDTDVVNLFRESGSRVFFNVKNGIIEKKVLPVPTGIADQIPNEAVCVIQIPLSELGITPYDQEYLPRPFDVVVPFKSRKTRWRYHINMPGVQSGMNTIVDRTEGANREEILFRELTPNEKLDVTADMKAPVSFISQQTLPLMSRDGYRFELRATAGDGTEKAVLNRLPMPDVRKLTKDPHNESELVSDIYIS